MPATSVDTFFACSLMVLLVLSAMAGASKLLYPHINNFGDEGVAERCMEISRHLLLNGGKPLDWGQNGQIIPESFGLAVTGSDIPYELDIDKVSRLNSENLYALSYAQIFTALKIPDVSFRIEIKPIFDVAINLTEAYALTNETVYQFEISTERHGAPVQTELKYYVIAENYFEKASVGVSNGETQFNVTLPNSVNGPALLVAIARSIYNIKVVSFGVYAFAHSYGQPKQKGTFLRLSPLNQTLTANIVHPETVLADAYALTFNYHSNLTQIGDGKYAIPSFADSSLTLMVVTGWNATDFFAEWTVYPQVPLQTGADFTSSPALSKVLAYNYIVTINSTLYQCTVWIGGLKE
ncbi:MAG: hypothetical protein QW270_03470 [Candidatus Bathyarchaeia archaeon]